MKHAVVHTNQANPASPALWQQLQAAATALAQVSEGLTAAQAVAGLPRHHQPAAQAMLYATLRQWGLVRALVNVLLKKQPSTRAWAALLQVSLGLLQTSMYEPHTLVNQAVTACKNHKKIQGLAPLLNGVLRRYLREKSALHGQVQGAQSGLEARYNYPAWWVERVQAEHPQNWQQILSASAEVAPQHIRVDASRTTVSSYKTLLQSVLGDEVSARPLGQNGLYLSPAQNVTELPQFDRGMVSVQDAAAQLAAPALLSYFVHNRANLEKHTSEEKPEIQKEQVTQVTQVTQAEQSTLRVLDACAAPGGKTLHLLEFAKANGLRLALTALDKDASRLERVVQNLNRAGLGGECVCIAANASQPSDWWDGQAFDAILLDAPCSASGIVRRHPDIPWLRRPSDIDQLAREQAALIETLWPLLKPGGLLLYITCSIWYAEGAAQMERFLKQSKEGAHGANLLSQDQLLPRTDKMPFDAVHNSQQEQEQEQEFGMGCNLQNLKSQARLYDHDGFFYALLQKQGN